MESILAIMFVLYKLFHWWLSDLVGYGDGKYCKGPGRNYSRKLQSRNQSEAQVKESMKQQEEKTDMCWTNDADYYAYASICSFKLNVPNADSDKVLTLLISTYNV